MSLGLEERPTVVTPSRSAEPGEEAGRPLERRAGWCWTSRRGETGSFGGVSATLLSCLRTKPVFTYTRCFIVWYALVYKLFKNVSHNEKETARTVEGTS